MTLDEVVRSLETPAAFAAWLTQFGNKNAQVGLPTLANMCPIASYARSLGVDGHVAQAKEFGGAVALHVGRQRRHLPEWCQFFAEMVDDEYDVCKRDAGHRPDDYPITAAMALRLLGHVAQEMTNQAEDMADLVLV